MKHNISISILKGPKHCDKEVVTLFQRGRQNLSKDPSASSIRDVCFGRKVFHKLFQDKEARTQQHCKGAVSSSTVLERSGGSVHQLLIDSSVWVAIVKSLEPDAVPVSVLHEI